MIQNTGANNIITFMFSRMNAIDLEALNLLAGQTERVLSSCRYCEYNRKHRLDYDVLSSNNLHLHRDLFSLENFIQACLELFAVVDKYHLNLANIKVKSQYIFENQEGYQFLYLPIHTKKKSNKKKFMVKLLGQFKDEDIKVASLLKQVKGMENDEMMLAYLEGCVAPTEVKGVQELEEVQEVDEQEGETTFLSQTETIEQEEEEGETTVLTQHTTEFLPNISAECETTFLSETPFHKEPIEIETGEEYNLFLLRVGTGEEIHISKSNYSIGKDIQTMDYVLGNQSVSRNHATIYIEDNRFYLTDNGSTNGTTIEGIRVQAGERAELSDGDIISLGNEVFQVLLERK